MTDKRIDPKLVAELLKDYQRPEDLIGPEGLQDRHIVDAARGPSMDYRYSLYDALISISVRNDKARAWWMR